MDNIAAKKIREELKRIIGPNLELTAELEKMLLAAYAMGQTDILETLGIDAEELSQDNDLIAWTA